EEDIRKLTKDGLESFLASSTDAALRAIAITCLLPIYVNINQPDKMLPLLEELGNFALVADNSLMACKCERLYGWYYLITEQFSTSLQCFEKSLAMAKESNLQSLIYSIKSSITEVYNRLGLKE